MPRSYWLKAAAITVVAFTVIGVPTRLIPNSFFSRMTPSGPLDYAFLTLSSILAGLTLALPLATRVGGAFAGGFGTFFAVGCPICNKLVVGALGVTGAMTYFAPIQPFLGAASVVLLAFTLRWRLRALTSMSCVVPVRGPADAT